MNKSNNLKSEDNQTFRYMMLSRLQCDCDYFLGCGNFSKRFLRSESIEVHINEMKNIWNLLPIKPEWLTLEKIVEYESMMLNEISNKS